VTWEAPPPPVPIAPYAGEPKKPPPPGPPPVIDEIIIEKKEVCSGDENLVTVRAHTLDGTDPFLHYTIGAATGLSIPVRATLDDDGRVAPRTISVFGANNVTSAMELPSYVVKDCGPRNAAFVQSNLRANTVAEFELSAKIVTMKSFRHDAAAAPSFDPIEWNWTFGDGTSARTNVPYVVHDFGDRPQDSLYSQMLIAVDIKSSDGQHLIGRHPLQLMNQAFEDFHYRGVVSLMAAFDPRFPELGSDGIVVQGVRLFHARPNTITIEKVSRIESFLGQGGDTNPVQVPVSQILGTTTIPPGKGISFKTGFDTLADTEVYQLTYTLEGKTPEGYRVYGRFSVMKPPPKPTKASNVPVYDNVLQAKILAARRLLGKEFVTDEDLWQLEREGKFKDLDVGPAIPPPTEPPKSLPKGPGSAAAPAPKTVPPPGAGPTGTPQPEPLQPNPKVTKGQ